MPKTINPIKISDGCTVWETWKKSYSTVQRVQQLKNTPSPNILFVDVTRNTLTTISIQLQPNPCVMMKTIAHVNFITHTNSLGLRVHGQLFKPAR